MPKKKRKAYIDMVDFTHELGEGLGGVRLYCSPEDLLQHETCAVECGIYQVSVEVLKVEKAPGPFDLSPYDDSVAAVCTRLIERYKTRIASFQAEIERLQKKIKEHS